MMLMLIEWIAADFIAAYRVILEKRIGWNYREEGTPGKANAGADWSEEEG